MDREYCPVCAPYLPVPEYDPETNWKVEGLEPRPPAPEYDPETNWKVQPRSPASPPAPPTAELERAAFELLRSVSVALRADQQITEFMEKYRGDLFAASSVFLLRRARLSLTPENKRKMHRVLRCAQLNALGISYGEIKQYGESHLSAALLRAIKTYDKDLFNLSPFWALKMAQMRTQKTEDLMLSLYSIDLILTAKKMV